MTYRCALCGRSMSAPSVTVGQMAIGPTCARKAGLIELGRKRSGFVRLFTSMTPRREDEKTMDLFEVAA